MDIAVDEIPRIAARDPNNVQFPPEVVADGPIALARLIPAGVDVRGEPTRARIVLFRKPIERRVKDTLELSELLHEILVAQVATYLSVEPDIIDPTIDDPDPRARPTSSRFGSLTTRQLGNPMLTSERVRTRSRNGDADPTGRYPQRLPRPNAIRIPPRHHLRDHTVRSGAVRSCA